MDGLLGAICLTIVRFNGVFANIPVRLVQTYNISGFIHLAPS